MNFLPKIFLFIAKSTTQDIFSMTAILLRSLGKFISITLVTHTTRHQNQKHMLINNVLPTYIHIPKGMEGTNEDCQLTTFLLHPLSVFYFRWNLILMNTILDICFYIVRLFLCSNRWATGTVLC